MKLLAAATLVACASAAVPWQQRILQNPLKNAEVFSKEGSSSEAAPWTKPLSMLADGMKSMSAEAKAAWEEVSLLFPDQMSKASFFSSPKPSKRRPDSHWDYIVHGEELQNLHTTDKNGNRERVIDGHLDTYKLRAKKVDPSKLGVDSVKQYSGYLDDEENDKHLFYCESNPNQ
jgi:cathepsin A (carboxypeptidase C)